VTGAAEVLPDWRRFLGRPSASGVIRAEIGDFRVEEQPLITPEGEGSHLWLEIEKRAANTNWVAGQLARCAGVRQRDVGFAGMKDRHGVTRQWFSIGMQEARDHDWPSWSIEGVNILQAGYHVRKLRRGVLSGNRFRIVVREFEGDWDELLERVDRAARRGVPNYFGPQRFGRGGHNVQRARDWLCRGARIRRNQRSIFLSAARSFLFNQLLSARVERGDWNRLLDGEMAALDGSRAVFACTLPDAELERRCAEFDIHPSGPLPGKGDGGVEREALALEVDILAGEKALVDGLAAAGAEAGRRSLRLRPAELQCEQDGDTLLLRFRLPPGAYATSLLRELVQLRDASGAPGP
jgi:tRNA pseudouridine13 synthase